MHLPDFKVARSSEKIDYNKINYKLDSKYLNKYKGKKCYLKTYGCQMNEHDSENIKGILELLGFDFTENIEEADLVLLNTCSIRENAHNKAFGLLGKAKHIKESKRDLMIGLCGCMAQEEIVVNTIMKKYPFVNFVVGTHNFYQIPEILEKSESKQQIEVYSREGDLIESMPVDRTSKYKAYVNIIYGCDKFCTYCIVPYTRGRQRSREKEDILKEIDNLIKKGYKEVTLLGQNVNAYGKDLYDDYSLAELLEDVAKTNIPRIRFMTSHPWDFTDEMIEVIAKYPNIMPSVHLPVQSGSDRILKLMGRRYTKDKYLTLFHKMKEMIPNVAISTDIIVGFPGETEEDFEETLKLVSECKYDNAYTFIFSPRIGTPAAKMEDNTSLKVKEERLAKLNELVNKYSLEHNKELLNKEVLVLIEGISAKDSTKLYGYTDTMKLINVEGSKDLIGKIVKVLITDAKSFSLDGKVIQDK